MRLGSVLPSLLRFAQRSPNVGDVVCRYAASSPSVVNYYTCTQIAEKYLSTVETFFELNPGIDRECSNIRPDTEYCVKGYIQYPVATNGLCGPKNGNASCLSTDFQCCNSETWKCGDTEEDCAAGTCWEGTCEGFPSDYSMDGKCGPAANGLRCGGKWGSCCSKKGLCGTGDDFCSFETCYSGECDLPPQPDNGLPWQTGTTPDGTCGGQHGYTCDVVYGNCCSKNGTCGSLDEHCGTGCQKAFGLCTAASGPPSTATPGLPAPSDVSPDGCCGGSNKFTCKSSRFGSCCSVANWCGDSPTHCGDGCQSAFGDCKSTNVSPDGSCGGTNGYLCKGSTFGDCCSSTGWCGSSTDHCSAGCQPAFGTCTGASNISPNGTCGGNAGYQCGGSTFGGCCSSSGYCGSAVSHCAQGCQKDFSNSCLTNNVPTLDGACGKDKGGFSCAGGPFDGQCCGASGYCGSTTNSCGTGCQPRYGSCS